MTLDDDAFREELECEFLINNSINGQIDDHVFNSIIQVSKNTMGCVFMIVMKAPKLISSTRAMLNCFIFVLTLTIMSYS